jgi:hypothetical protein
MEILHRLLRITLFAPLAIVGTLAVLSAQSTIILVALCFGIVRPMKRKSNARTHGEEALPKDGVARGPHTADTVSEPVSGEASGLSDVSFLPLRKIKPDLLILLPNEECYLQESARLIVQSAETQRHGGAGGFSIGRPAFNQMPSSGRGKRRGEPTRCDGRLYVTNTRIVFVGPVTVHMHIAQILTLEPKPTGVSLTFVSEPPMEFVTGNPRLGVILQKVVYRDKEPG